MTAKQRARNRRERKKAPTQIAEDRQAETVIVLWMLAALATFMALAIMLVLRIVVRLADAPAAIAATANLMLLVACVTGSLTMFVTPVTLRWARRSPPLSIAVLAMLIGVAPWLTLLAAWLAGVR